MQALDDDDDYVASLLKRDAEKHQKRFATGDFQASKRRPDAPKPNLRFLKNVLRDVDSHNTALKLKEEEESRVKSEDLSREQRRNGKRDREEDQDPERRKRQRQDPVKERQGRWKDALQGIGKSTGDRRGKTFRSHGEDDEPERSSKHRNRRHRHRSRSRTRSPSSERHRKHHRRRSEDRHRSRSLDHHSRHRRRDHKPSSTPTAAMRNRDEPKTASRDDEDDSDPLEDIIGPRAPPKVRHKGRGLPSTSTTMDSHFRSDYDPKTDISLNDGIDDEWDMALEALRDRAKWKAQGAERLKAAGFTDDQVKQWAKGGEKDVEDVVWRKKGEDREWDRGKTLDDEGEVEVKSNGTT